MIVTYNQNIQRFRDSLENYETLMYFKPIQLRGSREMLEIF
jgi:hypothetical protein